MQDLASAIHFNKICLCAFCIPLSHCTECHVFYLADDLCSSCGYFFPNISWMLHVKSFVKIRSAFSVPLNRQRFGIRVSFNVVKTSISFTGYLWEIGGGWWPLCGWETVCKGAACRWNPKGSWSQLSNHSPRSTLACLRRTVGVGCTKEL